VLDHAGLQHVPHSLRRLDGDDALGQERQGQRVTPAAGADVDPRLTRLRQRAQHVERRLVRAARIRAEVGGHGRVEVARRRPFAQALGLLAIGAHTPAPGLERAGRLGTKHVGHRAKVSSARAR
jgi:hypothetical protein